MFRKESELRNTWGARIHRRGQHKQIKAPSQPSIQRFLTTYSSKMMTKSVMRIQKIGLRQPKPSTLTVYVRSQKLKQYPPWSNDLISRGKIKGTLWGPPRSRKKTPSENIVNKNMKRSHALRRSQLLFENGERKCNQEKIAHPNIIKSDKASRKFGMPTKICTENKSNPERKIQEHHKNKEWSWNPWN